MQATAPELPCIRCGECAVACPAQLLPQTLLTQLRVHDFDAAARQGLADCIECGACAFVCPSQIPLVDWYRFGKLEIRFRIDRLARADRARERYQARNARLARVAAERVARVAARETVIGDVPSDDASAQHASIIDDVASAAPTVPPKPAVAPMDKSAVLAAIARAREKKKAATPPPAESDE